MFGNAWQAWTIHDLRSDLDAAEKQINGAKLRMAAALGTSGVQDKLRQRKTDGPAKAKTKPRRKDGAPRAANRGRLPGGPAGQPGSALSAEATVDQREQLRGRLRDAVHNKMIDAIGDVAIERGWDEGTAAEAILILEDSLTATAEVRVAMEQGDYTAAESKEEVARIKDDTSLSLEDLLGPDEHHYLQERLWSKDGR